MSSLKEQITADVKTVETSQPNNAFKAGLPRNPDTEKKRPLPTIIDLGKDAELL